MGFAVNAIEQQFAERVRAVRHARAWSVQELANRSGMHRVAISKIEVAIRGISLGEAVTLSEALGVPLDVMVRPGVFSVVGSIDFQVDHVG